jgi:arylsulfatase
VTRIALIVLDTLRKDAFDRHFDWLPGRRFEHAFSTANWTTPAHASLFTGRYASEVGVHAKHLHFDCERPSLAERLRAAGYTTHAFSANANLTPHFEFDRGFEDFRIPSWFEEPPDGVFDWRAFSRTAPEAGARKYLRGLYECVTGDYSTVRSLVAGARLQLAHGSEIEYGGTVEALGEIEDMSFGDRAFLFLNLMEAHEPYEAPAEYMSVEPPEGTDSVGDITVGDFDPERVRRAYDDCVRYLSGAYERLFERVSAEFDYVITVADHGEMLGEADAWGHEHGVHRRLTHVPLVVSGDGLSGECAAPVSLLDVHDTVLDLAGVDHDARNQVLTGDVDGGEYLAEYRGLTAWSERKLEHSAFADRIERYDGPLHGYVGPPDYYGWESLDGFEETGRSDAADPRERLQTLLAEREVRTVEEDTEVPDEISDQLEHLGYA